jgi:anti-sigma factor RsiW
MKCREFVEFLMEYLEGALAEGELCVFEEHIEDCPACVNYLATYRETVRLGKGICAPDAEVPPDVPEELVQAILSARVRRPDRG